MAKVNIARYEDPLSVDSIRGTLLRLENDTRRAQYVYENKYAQAHLEEVNLLLKMALVQLKYAAYADQAWDVRS